VDEGARASGASTGFFIACVSVAAFQVVFAERLSGLYHEDYWATLGAAWFGVLLVVHDRSSGHSPAPPAAWRLVGVIALASGLVPLLAAPTYHTLYRALPLLAGSGLFLIADGPGGLRRHCTELALLALPWVNPLPRALRHVLAPTSWTAWCAMQLARATGQTMTAEGSVLRSGEGTLDVLPDCGGLNSISRLWVLGALVVALFPTRPWQKGAIFVSAIAIGFLTNAVRIEVLALATSRGADSFDYWHEGAGSTLFGIASAAIACPAWGLMLFRSR
jgi:exosortase/archaeosortase family protein